MDEKNDNLILNEESEEVKKIRLETKEMKVSVKEINVSFITRLFQSQEVRKEIALVVLENVEFSSI